MATFRSVQASFVSGILSTSMLGRVDTELYDKAAKVLQNVYILPQGGAFRREGLEYNDTTTTSQAGRLVPFAFNNDQTYMLCFTPGEFKVYRTDVLGTVQATVTTGVSTLTAAQIAEMTWSQSADTLLIFHEDVQTIKITRTSHTAWTAVATTYANIPPFAFSGESIATPAGTVTSDVTTGIVTVTASGTPFTSAHVGQFINTPKGGRIYITAYTSTSVVDGIVQIELEGTGAISNWELETGYEDVISATKGWPSCGAFFKSRLVVGGLKSRPQTMLMSKIGSFFDLNIGSGLDNEGIDVTLDDSEVNKINNLFSGRGLQIFTTGGEFSVRTGLSEALTPSSIATQINKETLHGSLAVSPKSVDGATVFIEAEGAVVRQFVFNEVENSFNSPNISILAQDVLNAPVAMDIRRSVASHPTDYLYVVNGDGTVAVLNSLREQDLLAWTTFTTDGTFEDVAVSGRITYFIIKRTIDGNTVRYIERLNADHYLDASTRTDNGSDTTSWSGLDHLDGETVVVRGDDFILDDELVASGAITSSEAVTVLEAGIFAAAKITALSPNLVIDGQSFHGQWKSLQKVDIQLLESRNIVVQYDGNDHKPAFRQMGSGLLDEPVPLVTDFKQVFLGGITRDAEVTITQEEPLEFKVLSIVYTVKI